MTKKVSKAEKLDFLVREVGKIKKQLALLSEQHVKTAEMLAKLARPTARTSSDPAAAKRPAPKKPRAVAADPQSRPAPTTRRALPAGQEAAPVAAKLVS